MHICNMYDRFYFKIQTEATLCLQSVGRLALKVFFSVPRVLLFFSPPPLKKVLLVASLTKRKKG